MKLTAEQSRNRFYASVQNEMGFDIDEIKEILQANFGVFETARIEEYRMFLRRRYIQRLQKDEEIKSATPSNNENIPCPICGSKTYGDIDLFGRYTRSPGWVCTKGGKRHFIWHKANKIRAAQGLAPIDFQAVDWSTIKLHSETIGD